MRDPNFIDEQRNADYLDAMADIAYEQEEAMRESNQDDWDGIDEISSAERNACDHYNEREDDIVLHIIVILSILIEILIDAIRCLISKDCKSSTHSPIKHDMQSTHTTCTQNGKTRSQPQSRSTKQHSTTVDRKKVVGSTKQATPSKRTASSPRSRRSKPSSNT